MIQDVNLVAKASQGVHIFTLISYWIFICGMHQQLGYISNACSSSSTTLSSDHEVLNLKKIWHICHRGLLWMGHGTLFSPTSGTHSSQITLDFHIEDGRIMVCSEHYMGMSTRTSHMQGSCTTGKHTSGELHSSPLVRTGHKEAIYTFRSSPMTIYSSCLLPETSMQGSTRRLFIPSKTDNKSE